MKELWDVKPSEGGVKLLAFLKTKVGEKFSTRQLKGFLENNSCTLNGRIERFGSTELVSGDKITLTSHADTASFLKRPSILFEDIDLIVINKPSGISSEDPALKSFLGPSLGKLILMHRLDKGTSGALLFARNEKTENELQLLFRQRKIEKCYLAIVDGIPKKRTGIIDNFLGKIRGYQGQSVWGAVAKNEGLRAVTEWELERHFFNSSLLKCMPLTGRTHQIRVHLSGIGHPILGDIQYGRHFTCDYHPSRPLLHALSLSFYHPTTGKKITVTAPEPDDFKRAVQILEGVK